MIPTQRSVIARLRYRSLDGGWSEVSLCRATRIRVFPKNAAMDRKIFRAERKISSPSTPLINSTEQYSSPSVFLFSYSVKFVSAIFLCEAEPWSEGFIYPSISIKVASVKNDEWCMIHVSFRFGPTGKVSKKRVYLLRWTNFLVGPVGILVEWIAPEFYFVFKSRSQGLAKTMKCFKLTPNFNEPVETNSLTILMSFQ